MSVANFASEDEMLKASMDETAILGASRAALEGILSRRASLDKRILIPTYRQTTKTNKKVKPECAYEGGINGTKNDGGSHQLFHTKLHDALTRIYETKSYTSILGATFAAIEGAASRRMSRAVPPAGIEGQTSARLTLLSQEAPRSTKSSFDNDELQKTLNRKVDDLLARGKWKPSNCPSRYAKLFPMLPRTREKEGDDTIKLNQQERVHEVHFDAAPGPWCGCCMKEAIDPYQLPCGHSFCKKCIADTNFFLLRDHAKVVKDTRAVMRCPLRCCKAVIPCLPLINGDFRFQRVHPEDKVPLPDAKINLCEQHRLTTYKIRIDVDVTKRKSDNLFDGFDDVIIVP
ncbi:hypothetical protein RRG08_018660 [Elysia crispata]|uniref:RING-type domain-containing protein n=1 Tax=Elysia crispata TaxID=231223 RepID=A0AAE1CPY5_9GAST|nr:hypothetical protein RRG08_018660 [Elysia crispata]